MKSVEQQRAAHALARIEELQRRPDGFKARYRAYVDRLGPAIVMNGLGQALATERAGAGWQPTKDDERAHHELYGSLQQWLCREDGGVYRQSGDLLQAIMNNDEEHYLRAQAESLAWLEWHKKCCRASFPADASGDD
ncbi:MAG: type III-B CRISPR module-associated protein Cmr5 [Spirochaetaceae bacterium]|nr:type III-B CRISPR module-associated protein Cmr5 [Spirochaetaceae bacterium]